MSRAITADGRRAGALIIERSYREGDDRQFLRELVQNGIEAGATKVQLGVHWTGVNRDWSQVELPEGHINKIFNDRYRLVYYDNGCGMGSKMADYMAGLLDLDSKDQASGDIHATPNGCSCINPSMEQGGCNRRLWTEEFPEAG